MANYANVSIPPELATEIDKVIGRHKGLGYRTRAEFVKEAIRAKLEKYVTKV